MQIRMRDGRVLNGTPLEIVEEMRDLAFFESPNLNEYITWTIEQAESMRIKLVVVGDTDDERCASLIDSMIENDLAEVFTGTNPTLDEDTPQKTGNENK